jgi:Fe-S-cluster containining protein
MDSPKQITFDTRLIPIHRKPIDIQPLEFPVDPNWKCQQDGACCRIPEIAMTRSEAQVLQLQASVLPDRPHLSFVEHPINAHFVLMQAGPCPFLGVGLDGRSSCRVYSHRPYNCRRFQCLRPDVKTEPFIPDQSEFGCANTSQRLKKSRVARRMFALLQRKAMKWARNHGWQG